MKKSLPHIQYSRLLAMFNKLNARLNRHFAFGRFASFSKSQQHKLVSRIARIKLQLQRLEQGLKLAGTALTLGLALCSTDAQAQFGPIGSEFLVNTATAGNQLNSSIAMDSDGDFVVAWESYQDGSGYGVYAQRYNALGVAQGLEFRVNTYTTSDQYNPSIAMDVSGDFVVAWQSDGQDGYASGVYAQRYDALGVAQGVEFRVNTYTTSHQRNPSIAMDSDGDFVVAWQSYGQDGSGSGVYAQRYDALGVAQGLEFRVNTYTASDQANPSIAMDASGDFVVTWQSYGQDGSIFGVYAQRYDALDVAQGLEFRVNTYTAGSQGYTFIAMDASGDFVVAWESYQDGSSYGVYVQRFGIPLNAAPTDISLSATAVDENVAANTTVGTLSSTDADASNTFTYTLVAGTGDTDNASFNILGDALRITVSPDFETKSSYSIRVRTTDQGSLSFEKEFTITINDLIETSVLTGANGASLQLFPNPAQGQVFLNLEGEANINVLDLSGHVVKQTQTSYQSFSIAGLQAGVYLVEISQGESKAMKKLVVK